MRSHRREEVAINESVKGGGGFPDVGDSPTSCDRTAGMVEDSVGRTFGQTRAELLIKLLCHAWKFKCCHYGHGIISNLIG